MASALSTLSHSQTKMSRADVESVASSVPPNLSATEEELAWLAEESLVFGRSLEIDWNYVKRASSKSLRSLIDASGGRRPLQRIVRTGVKAAFEERSETIAFLILFQGYRRQSMSPHVSLPSHEELEESGILDQLKLKRFRWSDKKSGKAREARDDRRCDLSDISNSPQTKKKRKRRKSSQLTAPAMKKICPMRDIAQTTGEGEKPERQQQEESSPQQGYTRLRVPIIHLD